MYKKIYIKILGLMLAFGSSFAASSSLGNNICYADKIVSKADVDELNSYSFDIINNPKYGEIIDRLDTILSYRNDRFVGEDAINYRNRIKQISDILERKVGDEGGISNKDIKDIFKGYAKNFREKVLKIEDLQKSFEKSVQVVEKEKPSLSASVEENISSSSGVVPVADSLQVNVNQNSSIVGAQNQLESVQTVGDSFQKAVSEGSPKESNLSSKVPVVDVPDLKKNDYFNQPVSLNNSVGVNEFASVNRTNSLASNLVLNTVELRHQHHDGSLLNLNSSTANNNRQIISDSDIDKMRNCSFRRMGEKEREVIDWLSDILSYRPSIFNDENVNDNLRKLQQIVNILEKNLVSSSWFGARKDSLVAASDEVTSRLRIYMNWLNEKIKKIKELRRGGSEGKTSVVSVPVLTKNSVQEVSGSPKEASLSSKVPVVDVPDLKRNVYSKRPVFVEKYGLVNSGLDGENDYFKDIDMPSDFNKKMKKYFKKACGLTCAQYFLDSIDDFFKKIGDLLNKVEDPSLDKFKVEFKKCYLKYCKAIKKFGFNFFRGKGEVKLVKIINQIVNCLSVSDDDFVEFRNKQTKCFVKFLKEKVIPMFEKNGKFMTLLNLIYGENGAACRGLNKNSFVEVCSKLSDLQDEFGKVLNGFSVEVFNENDNVFIKAKD